MRPPAGHPRAGRHRQVERDASGHRPQVPPGRGSSPHPFRRPEHDERPSGPCSGHPYHATTDAAMPHRRCCMPRQPGFRRRPPHRTPGRAEAVASPPLRVKERRATVPAPRRTQRGLHRRHRQRDAGDGRRTARVERGPSQCVHQAAGVARATAPTPRRPSATVPLERSGTVATLPQPTERGNTNDRQHLTPATVWPRAA